MYYVFWGICTVAVVAGQIYVGSGYRAMSESTDRIHFAILKSLK